MIQGNLFHMGSLLAPTNDQLHFAQIFFNDPEEATTIWTARHSNDLGVLQQLTKMLYTFNPYIELYKTANETLKDDFSANNNLQIVLNIQIQLVIEVGADRPCENHPTSNEVTAIIINKYGNPCERDIILIEWVNEVNRMSMK